MKTVESVLLKDDYRRLWGHSGQSFLGRVTMFVVLWLVALVLNLIAIPAVAESVMAVWMPPEIVERTVNLLRSAVLFYVFVTASMLYNQLATERRLSRLLKELKSL